MNSNHKYKKSNITSIKTKYNFTYIDLDSRHDHLNTCIGVELLGNLHMYGETTHHSNYHVSLVRQTPMVKQTWG